MTLFFLLFLGTLFVLEVSPWNNGLALTPPMGWANWNYFGCNYNDSLIRAEARAMANDGFRDAGYEIIIIQECIVPYGNRLPNGTLVPDPNKFPYGMRNLSDYIHSLDLKVGIYTDIGPKTCAGYEGSFDYEQDDANTFINSWKMDFIEEDSCNAPQNYTFEQLYTRMHNAINNTGIPTIFYMCEHGKDNVQTWGPSTGHLWRTTGDICSPGHATWGGMIGNFYGNNKYPNVTGPSHWQDPDMMVVGMNGLTPIEWRTHFSLWCISAAPLWIGVDLRNVTDTVKNILLNYEVISVDQDSLGVMGVNVNSSVYSNYYRQVYIKQLTLNSSNSETMANSIVAFNANSTGNQSFVLDFNDMGFNGTVYVRDLWLHKDLGEMSSYRVTLQAHDCVMLRIYQK